MSMVQETKVTYATLTADNVELQDRLDEGFAAVRAQLGRSLPFSVDGQARTSGVSLESRSPMDHDLLLARVSCATTQDVQDAVRAAKAAWPAWRAKPWQERCEILERAAALIRENLYELTAWLVLEMGKNRVEALGEIEETADLYLYYAQQMRDNGGFLHEMGRLSPHDTNTSVMRPHGVWAVIAPWNFPYALLGAPVAAALVTGNTVVCKPSSETPVSGVKIVEIFEKAGCPPGTVNLLVGGGRSVGDALVHHPDVAGLTFTGSYETGFGLYQKFSTAWPKPCIVEMGGKNPALVMPSADLERAVAGVWRSAYGMGGQKCSACSRVYVHQDVADEFLARLVKMAEDTVIGDPALRQTFLGPVGTAAGYRDYQRYSETARSSGTVLTGAQVMRDGDLARGFYVRPTLVTDLPHDHELLRKELFLPFVCAERVGSLDEALALANDTPFGLTAGFFSQVPEEIDTFLDRIEAGVVYVNRAAGATTGAWPGVQPFGGWKGSGSTGKNIGGLYTLQCYLREQSRTITA